MQHKICHQFRAMKLPCISPVIYTYQQVKDATKYSYPEQDLSLVYCDYTLVRNELNVSKGTRKYICMLFFLDIDMAYVVRTPLLERQGDLSHVVITGAAGPLYNHGLTIFPAWVSN